MTEIVSSNWIYGKAAVVSSLAAFVICACVIGMDFAVKVTLIALAILLFSCSITAVVVSFLFAFADARRNRTKKHRGADIFVSEDGQQL